MIKTDFFNELYNLYGPVTRARNCFFYTKKGVRITDCYQEDGRAILGWEGGNAFTHFKNVLSRGQVGSFICEGKSRLKKAVETLLDCPRNLMFFSTKMDAIKAALQISQETVTVYIPWAQTDVQWKESDAVVIVPPLPWTDSLYILAANPDKLPENAHLQNEIKLPFALQTAAARAIYNLIDAFKKREEKNWFIYDTVLTKYFERKGPYLYPKIPKENYDDFLLHCLKLGIVFNPEYKNSIVPFGADRGVFTKLKNSPFTW